MESKKRLSAKEKLAGAMEQLLMKKDLDDIQVREIADLASLIFHPILENLFNIVKYRL